MLEILLDLCTSEESFRQKVSAQKDAPSIFARVLAVTSGRARTCLLKLVEVWGTSGTISLKRFGMQPGVIQILTGDERHICLCLERRAGGWERVL